MRRAESVTTRENSAFQPDRWAESRLLLPQPVKLRPERLAGLTAAFGRKDCAALVWTLLFIGWITFDWFGPTWATAIDLIFFAPLGLAVGTLQLQVAARLENQRERIAWRLLAVAAFSRFISGTVWGIWIALYGGSESPPWMLVLSSAYLGFGIAGLLTFPGVAWRPVDRLRFRIDGAILLFGSVLVVWFFALGPFFSATAESARLQDYIYTIGNSVTVVLAAALYLRSGTGMMRTVSALLLVAFTLQVIPDIVLNWGKDPYVYRAGDLIGAVWYAVWLVKWVAARYALDQMRRPGAASRRPRDDYWSGVMPHAFLIAATAVLLYQVLSGNRQDSTLFLFGSGSLAALLVARHAVELRERDRLHGRQLAEEARYGALLHHAYDFVALLDADGRATYVSPATARLLGDTAPLYRPWGLLAAAHPDDRARLQSALTAPSLHTTPVALACRMRDASGGWRDLSLRLQDLKSDPLVAAVVVNGHDQTREARLSQRLQESEEVEALGIFAGGLAHDLNNILTVIGSHVDLLQSEPDAELQTNADLRAIRVATNRAATLTRGLLALSRRKSSSREAVDVGVLVRERLDAQRATREWPVTMQASGRTVHADPLSLSQVVDAILNDAASERQGGLVSPLTLATRAVDADAARDLEIEPGLYLVLRVGQTLDAVGTAVQLLARTLPTSAEWDSSPDDLGMLMALAAVREVGGTLTLESAGEERCVSVYLPSVLV